MLCGEAWAERVLRALVQPAAELAVETADTAGAVGGDPALAVSTTLDISRPAAQWLVGTIPPAGSAA
ncbi:hypothetical protein ACU686_26475 [Yinghuangia aomiensis]